jgi:hypothetical protein
MIQVLRISVLSAIAVLGVVFWGKGEARGTPPPREDAREDSKTYSQGTRGCPSALGKLAVFGISEDEGGYYLESANSEPSIAFVVEGEKAETLAISLGEVDDSLNYKSLWEYEVVAAQQQKHFLTLPPLPTGKDYRLTIQLICSERSGYGRSLSFWVRSP